MTYYSNKAFQSNVIYDLVNELRIRFKLNPWECCVRYTRNGTEYLFLKTQENLCFSVMIWPPGEKNNWTWASRIYYPYGREKFGEKDQTKIDINSEQILDYRLSQYEIENLQLANCKKDTLEVIIDFINKNGFTFSSNRIKKKLDNIDYSLQWNFYKRTVGK